MSKDHAPLTKTDKVRRQVMNVLVDQLGVDEEEVTPDASLVHDLGADSLDMMLFRSGAATWGNTAAIQPSWAAPDLTAHPNRDQESPSCA